MGDVWVLGRHSTSSQPDKNLYVCVCRSVSGQYSDSRGGSLWSGELSKNTAGFGYSEKQVTIAVDSAGAAVASGSKGDVRSVKDVPLWLAHSTVDDNDYNDRQLLQLQVTTTISSTFVDISTVRIIFYKCEIFTHLLNNNTSSSAIAERRRCRVG